MCECGTDEALHGSGSSVSSFVSQTSGTVSSSMVSSRSGVIEQSGVGTFHSLSRLQEICESSLNLHYLCTCVFRGRYRYRNSVSSGTGSSSNSSSGGVGVGGGCCCCHGEITICNTAVSQFTLFCLPNRLVMNAVTCCS